MPAKASAAQASAVQHLPLARLIDDALALLAQRRQSPLGPAIGPAVPLPSLLDRCEALLKDAANAPTPLRVVHSFASAAEEACSALLARTPNVRLCRTNARGMPAPDKASEALLADAGSAAVLALQDGHAARGLHLVWRVDQRARYAMSPQGQPPRLGLAGLQRAMRGVVVAEHPLLSYQAAVRGGFASFGPDGLEVYCQGYLAFLADHADVPVVTAEQIAADPAEALRRIAMALDLPQPTRVLTELARESADIALAAAFARPDPAEIARAEWPEGDWGTAPDGEAFRALCRTLGYKP